MCGISVVIHASEDSSKISRQLDSIALVQKHRGPDGVGQFIESNNGITLGLGHQRLSILDLSSAGSQPMHSSCGRYVLVFNGEIYNYQDLRRQLSGYPELNASSGDTAVLLAALACWGSDALNKLVGMWSFAFYDRKSHTVLLSRDRMGMKPLYYHFENEQLCIASEIKALLSVADRKFQLNYDSINQYSYQSLTNVSSETFFEGISSIPAGTYLKFRLEDFEKTFSNPLSFETYWKSPLELEPIFHGKDPVAQFRKLFLQSVERHLLSDVPVGLLLSGGIDSSSILGSAKQITGAALPCYSIISSKSIESEQPFIEEAADFTGAETYFLDANLNPHYYLDQLPDICRINEQPIGTMSVVLHRELIRCARTQGLKVLINGQGADEQLGGYNKFFYFLLQERLKQRKFWAAGKQLLSAIQNGTILKEFTFHEAKRYLPSSRESSRKATAGEALVGARSFDSGFSSTMRRRELVDLSSASLPMILHYEDRMSMSESVEMRIPFLDNDLMQFIGELPNEWQISNGWTKFILREAMKGIVPESIRLRKDKKGFSLPEASWARNEFKDRFMEVFNGSSAIYDRKLFKKEAVQGIYNQFLNGSWRVSFKDVFNVYCMEIWLRTFDDKIA